MWKHKCILSINQDWYLSWYFRFSYWLEKYYLKFWSYVTCFYYGNLPYFADWVSRMSPKAPNIQLLGETLTRHYRLSCELYNTYPIGRFTHQLSQGNLEINISDIDLDHLEALCHTLQNKVTPLQVFIYIPPGKEGNI